MNLTKIPKRIRNSTEDEEVNIESETSEGSDFLQRWWRLNKKAHRAKAKLCSKTQTEKSKAVGKSLTETEIAYEKKLAKTKTHPCRWVDLFAGHKATNRHQRFWGIP